MLTKVAKTSQPWVATLVRTIFDQPDAAKVAAQFDRVVHALAGKLPAAAGHLAAARDDLLAFTATPREIWRQIWSSNPQVILSPVEGVYDVVGEALSAPDLPSGRGYLWPVQHAASGRRSVCSAGGGERLAG